VQRRGQRRDQAQTLKPLRRKPKQLTEEPTLMDVSQGGTGQVLAAGSRSRSGDKSRQGGGSGPGVTDEQGALTGADGHVAVDPETLRRAREIAARLALPRPRRDLMARRGAGTLATAAYRGGSADIDLDRTLERLIDIPAPKDTDILVRERIRTRRSVVLLVDVSGSMRGERVRTAAATVGALASELSGDGPAGDDLAVVAFWSDAAVLAHLGRRVPPGRIVESMVRMPAQGLTNLAFPLQAAQRELARVPARDARVLLLSDCVHNAGPDPRPLAARLPRLEVLLDVTGEQDPELARDLARLGRGRLRTIRTYRDVAPALSEFFAS
jgi:Mg-chelatase subunit ChlD